MIYPWLYLAAFSLPNPLIFRWYLAPPLPPYYFFIFLGAGTLLHGLFDKLSFIPPAWGRALVGVALILPIISSLASWTLHQDHGPDRPAPDMAFIKMELLYRQAAEITKAGPGDTIAAGDVGVLGYYTPARILDTVGLNSPLSLRYYPLDPAAYVTNYAIPPDLIIDQKPDWVIFMEVYGRRSLLQDQRFLKAYTLRETLPTDIFGSRGMLIYERSFP